jgi:hypothetical protein
MKNLKTSTNIPVADISQITTITTVTNTKKTSSKPVVSNTSSAYIYEKPKIGISRYDFNTGKKIIKTS